MKSRLGARALSSGAKFCAGLLASTAMTSFILQPIAWAADGAVVTSGSATVSGQGSAHVIVNQNSQNAVINWTGGMDVGTGEWLQFKHPNRDAATLNRDTSGNLTDIGGRLTANGNVFIVNPHGVLFRSGSQVDVGGLVASTADIADDDFMNGKRAFTIPGEVDASVINRGAITIADGGLAAFVAPGVENSGVINARLGKVALASGDTFTLDMHGDGLIQIAVSGDVAPTDENGVQMAALVSNSGEIYADGGVVTLTARGARGAVDNAISMNGVVEANSIGTQNGKIVLSGGEGDVTVDGTLSARGDDAGETGGAVDVFGETVTLAENAEIDASGDSGGGEVRVGGDYKGGGDAPTAANANMVAGARILADAIRDGDGGKVILWSDGTTLYAGSITARGGAEAGDGGFIETSGKDTIQLQAIADASAVNGKAGTWLIDPTDITISNGAANVGGETGGTPTTNTGNTITDGTINTVLDAGTSIVITTNIGGADSGDITIEADALISKTGGGDATLTLEADRDIIATDASVNATVIESSSGELTVVMTAGRNIDLGRDINTNGGDVSLTAGENATVANINTTPGREATTTAAGTTAPGAGGAYPADFGNYDQTFPIGANSEIGAGGNNGDAGAGAKQGGANGVAAADANAGAIGNLAVNTGGDVMIGGAGGAGGAGGQGAAGGEGGNGGQGALIGGKGGAGGAGGDGGDGGDIVITAQTVNLNGDLVTTGENGGAGGNGGDGAGAETSTGVVDPTTLGGADIASLNGDTTVNIVIDGALAGSGADINGGTIGGGDDFVDFNQDGVQDVGDYNILEAGGVTFADADGSGDLSDGDISLAGIAGEGGYGGRGGAGGRGGDAGDITVNGDATLGANISVLAVGGSGGNGGDGGQNGANAPAGNGSGTGGSGGDGGTGSNGGEITFNGAVDATAGPVLISNVGGVGGLQGATPGVSGAPVRAAGGAAGGTTITGAITGGENITILSGDTADQDGAVNRLALVDNLRASGALNAIDAAVKPGLVEGQIDSTALSAPAPLFERFGSIFFERRTADGVVQEPLADNRELLIRIYGPDIAESLIAEEEFFADQAAEADQDESADTAE